MKKALIVLLILAVAGGMFAQELTWSVGIETGVIIDIKDADDDIHVTATDDDGGYFHWSVGGNYEADGWGLMFGTSVKIEDDFNAAVGLDHAHGWMDFVDGMLRVRAGSIDPGVWGTGGWVDAGYAAVDGLRLEVMPIEGLNVGLAFGWPDGGVFANKIGNFFQEIVFGFEYATGDMKMNASLKVYSEESSRGDTDLDVTAGFGFDGVENLKLYFGVELVSLMVADNPTIRIGENIDFAVSDQLGVGLEAGETLCDGLQEVFIKPFANFDLGDGMGVGAEICITMEKDGDDNLGLSTIAPNLWFTKAIGGAEMKVGYGFEMKTKDYGDSLDHYVKLIFSYSY
ncbi:MAG: hypothetical protein LBH42_05010 [Treponema sp.]|jgi:hypothetical protein|nr:hypothetical protein [Treponema sp.]